MKEYVDFEMKHRIYQSSSKKTVEFKFRDRRVRDIVFEMSIYESKDGYFKGELNVQIKDRNRPGKYHPIIAYGKSEIEALYATLQMMEEYICKQTTWTKEDFKINSQYEYEEIYIENERGLGPYNEFAILDYVDDKIEYDFGMMNRNQLTCIKVSDDYFNEWVVELMDVDVYWFQLSRPKQGFARYGVTLIPPESIPRIKAVAMRDIEIASVSEFIQLLDQAINQNKYVIHFGI